MNDVISVFKGIAANPIQVTTWTEALKNIKSDKYKKAINIARSITDPEEYRKYKQTLPAVTFCGTFKERRSIQNIESSTGFIIPDLDHIQDVEETFNLLLQDQNVWFLFRSPSGAGLKAGLRAEGVHTDEDIKVFFTAVETYFLELYGIKIDPACKDICRLTFVSYDPRLWINPSPILFDVEAWSRTVDYPMPVYEAALYGGNGAGKEKYARKVLESSCEKIAQSAPGSQHHTRLKMARLLGGFSQYLDLSEIMVALEQAVRASGAKNIGQAMKTIADGLKYGASRPLVIPDRSDSVSSFTGNSSLSYILPVYAHAPARIATGVPERVNFKTGHREASMSYLANQLTRSGTPQEEIQEYLRLAATKLCDPPFEEKELQDKIKSILNRQERSEKSLMQEVRDFLLVTESNFRVTDLEQYLGKSNKSNKAVLMALKRLREEGVVEKLPMPGHYKPIKMCEGIVDINTVGDAAYFDNVILPMGLDKWVKLSFGNLIVIGGATNAGKSAIALNFTRDNMARHKILYVSTEMSNEMVRERIRMFDGDIDWKFEVIDKWDEQSNLIVKPNDITIIDWLHAPGEDPYKIKDKVNDLYAKVEKGLLIVALQKNPGALDPWGGPQSYSKSSLYLAMDLDENYSTMMRIGKAKAYGKENPNRWACKFRFERSVNIVMESPWMPPMIDENSKYSKAISSKTKKSN